MRSSKDPNSAKVQAILAVAKWAFIFLVGVGIFKTVASHHAAYKLKQAEGEAQLRVVAALREKELRLAKAKEEADLRLAEIERGKAETEAKTIIAKAEIERVARAREEAAKAEEERVARAREAERLEMERVAKAREAEAKESVEKEVRAYFASDDEYGHRRRVESSFFTDRAMYFGDDFTSKQIDEDSKRFERLWPVHRVIVDGIDVVEFGNDRFQVTVRLRSSRGMTVATASPFFPLSHIFQGIREGARVKFTSVQNPDVANSLVAKFQMMFGPEDVENGTSENIFELNRRNKFPDPTNFVREIIVRDRVNFYKGAEFRDRADQPADWFLLDSTRKANYQNFRKLPMTIEPEGWQLREGKMMEVEISLSRVSVKIRP